MMSRKRGSASVMSYSVEPSTMPTRKSLNDAIFMLISSGLLLARRMRFVVVEAERAHGRRIVDLEQHGILRCRPVQVLVPVPRTNRKEIAGTPVIAPAGHDGDALALHDVVELATCMPARQSVKARAERLQLHAHGAHRGTAIGRVAVLQNDVVERVWIQPRRLL